MTSQAIERDSSFAEAYALKAVFASLLYWFFITTARTPSRPRRATCRNELSSWPRACPRVTGRGATTSTASTSTTIARSKKLSWPCGGARERRTTTGSPVTSSVGRATPGGLWSGICGW